MNTNYGRWIDADSLIMALETREVPELQTVKDIIATQPTKRGKVPYFAN